MLMRLSIRSWALPVLKYKEGCKQLSAVEHNCITKKGMEDYGKKNN